jgi:predicted amidohydrolase
MSDLSNTSGRRQFLAMSGAAAVAGNLALPDEARSDEGSVPTPRLPREVRIATVCQQDLQASSPKAMVAKVVRLMGQTVTSKPDLICLPEVFPVANLSTSRPSAETVATAPLASLCRPIAEFAAKHRCYVVCPTYVSEGGRCFNAAILIDRDGKEVGTYKKIRLTEAELAKGLAPGPIDPPVFETDFGNVGIQICFDVFWPDGWKRLAEKKAEIVVWPSAFGGGRQIKMAAAMNRLVIATSTRKGTSQICDVTGEAIATTSRWNPWTVATVNLEKTVVHTWPIMKVFPKMFAKYGDKIRIRTFAEEEWSIVESRSPEVRLSDIAKEFGLVQIDEMLREVEAKQVLARKSV